MTTLALDMPNGTPKHNFLAVAMDPAILSVRTERQSFDSELCLVHLGLGVLCVEARFPYSGAAILLRQLNSLRCISSQTNAHNALFLPKEPFGI